MNGTRRFNEWFLEKVASHYDIERFNLLLQHQREKESDYGQAVRQLHFKIAEQRKQLEYPRYKHHIMYFFFGAAVFVLVGWYVRDHNMEFCNIVIDYGIYNCTPVNKNVTYTLGDCYQSCFKNTPGILFLTLLLLFLLFGIGVR